MSRSVTEPSSPSDHSVRPIRAVLFDFHGTLAQLEPMDDAVRKAAAAAGTTVTPDDVARCADALADAGWVGSGRPVRIPSALDTAWERRDLSEDDHRRAFTGVAATLSAIRRAGASTALVSNIGFDARPILRHRGLDELLDDVLLSFEVGAIKPDPAIFLEACRRLGVEPGETLMVGDADADAGARAIGIRTVLLPFAGPGAVVGLDVVRAAVEGSRMMSDSSSSPAGGALPA